MEVLSDQRGDRRVSRCLGLRQKIGVQDNDRLVAPTSLDPYPFGTKGRKAGRREVEK